MVPRALYTAARCSEALAPGKRAEYDPEDPLLPTKVSKHWINY